MNATVANPEVRSYLEAVRAHLGDIPDCDVEELLDDLEGHLLEVAAEDDGSLEDRLGPPSVYAEELRITAGLPVSEPSDVKLSRRIVRRFDRSAARRLIDAASGSQFAGALRAFLPELRPGWWVLRGYVLVAAISLLQTETYGTNPFVPYIGGSYALGAIAVVAAIWGSIALGRASVNQPRLRRASIVASLFIAGLGVAGVTQAADTAYFYDEASYYPQSSYLMQPDGSAIMNICPYAADGTPLLGVLLFDQDGRAISNTYQEYPVGQPTPMIQNAYPRQLLIPDPNTGELFPLPCPTLPKAGPAPTATPGG